MSSAIYNCFCSSHTPDQTLSGEGKEGEEFRGESGAEVESGECKGERGAETSGGGERRVEQRGGEVESSEGREGGEGKEGEEFRGER